MEAPNGEGKYYLNMCGAVVDSAAKAAGCGNAAVCLVNAGVGTSFGSSQQEQIIKEGEGFKVAYNDGAACSSARKFICDNLGVLVNTEDF